MFLGVDGGGTKTTFLLLNPVGRVLARAEGGTSYHPEVGLEGVREVLRRGTHEVLAAAGLTADAIGRAFFGLPAYGEDPLVDPELALTPSAALDASRYRVGNDMLCGWAGALACTDGVSVTAGTGSIAYGEYAGRSARCGGWGEVFGDEGSAHWIGREGLAAFSRMSDGRLPPGPLLALLRSQFGVAHDLDLAGRINSDGAAARSAIAGISRIVAAAAAGGDAASIRIFVRAGHELAALVRATRAQLAVPAAETLAVSYSGGVFNTGAFVLEPFRAALAADGNYRLQVPLLSPAVGAALVAARDAGVRFDPECLDALA
jgi:N-acetylglucosamine kinase-like BadF-type ATPase